MDLTVISFIVAVVGMILQLSDAFPEHRETRKVIVILSIGIFIGIISNVISGTNFKVTGNVDNRFALLYVLAGIACLFGVIAVFVGSAERREAALWGAGVAAAIFLMAALGIGLGSTDRVRTYSTDEVRLLAKEAERRGQYETAINRYRELKGRLEGKVAREEIQRRIERLQVAQAESEPNELR